MTVNEMYFKNNFGFVY